MVYIQAETRGGYISRSLNLDPNARLDGYPGYTANIGDQRSSIRTILYMEDNILYLTRDRTFFLTSVRDDTGEYVWIFTSSPDAEPLTLLDIQGVWGVTVWPWRDEWANMSTDPPTRNDLIWPVRSWEEAWNIIREQKYTIAFKRMSINGWGEQWISPISSFGGTAMVTAGFAWKGEAAPFHLLHNNGAWGLQYLDEGTIDAELTVSFKRNRKNAYVKSWTEGQSNRWLLTDTIGEALFFDVSSQDNGMYQFSYMSRRLNQGGCWRVRPLTICGVNTIDQGVEFYNGNKSLPIYMSANIITPYLDNTMRYRLAQNKFVNLRQDQNNYLPPYDPIMVWENLPRGSVGCNENEWQGSNVTCYSRSNTPYTQQLGLQQCTTLDDLSNDTHCQQWVLANKGPTMDTKLYKLCKDVPYGEYADVCSCFHPDQIYYDAILGQYRNDRELGRDIANDVRATNLLQCGSGLCKPGTFSANAFYHGAKRCDVCIQALRFGIQAGGDITGDINLRQICTQADITYTWNDLVSRLIDLGAYKVVRDPTNGSIDTIGTFPHVIINADNTSIKLITSTRGGMVALQNIPLLASVDNRDNEGNIILTPERWRNNPSGYSNAVLLFFLDAREE